MKSFKQILMEAKRKQKALREETASARNKRSVETQKVVREKDDDLAARVFRAWTGT